MARATFKPSVVALGSGHDDGTLINEGIRSISFKGAGHIDDRPGSTVRQPDETLEDGTLVYYG